MRLSRDEIIERGLLAKQRGEDSHMPWIYYAKVKVGRRVTQNVMGQYYNIPHLMADVIMNHARERENISVYGLRRVMRYQLRSMREDI